MKILLSNDDGYRAPGLAVLARALAPLSEITVVAPERNCSGASNSLSLHNELRVRQNHNGFYSVDGTPADCVHLAIRGLLDFEPDMVVAGINHGENLGDDVIYSGTVAAAIEGRFLGLPAIAVSLAGTHMTHYQTAAEVIIRVLENLRARPLPRDTILNINVPDLPFAQLRGLRATRLGARHQSQPIIEAAPPSDASDASGADAVDGTGTGADGMDGVAQRIYRIGPVGDGADAGPGTDFDAVAAGAVSVTPLQIDMTRHNSVENIANWLVEMTP